MTFLKGCLIKKIGEWFTFFPCGPLIKSPAPGKQASKQADKKEAKRIGIGGSKKLIKHSPESESGCH